MFTKTPVVIFDIDGTIADASHRKHFLDGPKKNWKAFLSGCDKDEVIPQTVKVMHMMQKMGYLVVFFTGRSEEYRQMTTKWLKERLYLDHEPILHMRPDGNFDCDSIIKEQMLDRFLERNPGAEIFGVFDDRKVVCEMWNRRGIFCFDVAQGQGDF